MDWKHMDWAVFASTVVLALVTSGLVFFTRRLASEARETRAEMRLARAEAETARLQSVRPKLSLGTDNQGAGFAFVSVTNVGEGAALDVHATLTFQGLSEQRPVAFHLVARGETLQFIPPENCGELMRMDALAAAVSSVTLVGTMRDALGTQHTINESIDLAAVWQKTVASQRRLPPDYPKRVADEIEKTRKTLENLDRTARRAYDRAWPNGPPPEQLDGADM